jgi:hypothetical protein
VKAQKCIIKKAIITGSSAGKYFSQWHPGAGGLVLTERRLSIQDATVVLHIKKRIMLSAPTAFLMTDVKDGKLHLLDDCTVPVMENDDPASCLKIRFHSTGKSPVADDGAPDPAPAAADAEGRSAGEVSPTQATEDLRFGVLALGDDKTITLPESETDNMNGTEKLSQFIGVPKDSNITIAGGKRAPTTLLIRTNQKGAHSIIIEEKKPRDIRVHSISTPLLLIREMIGGCD